MQHGKPNSDWKSDTVGQPVNPAIKFFQTISLKVAKMVRSNVEIDTGNEHLNAAGSVAAQVAEDQIAADPHATPQERLKMAGGTALDGVQQNVDNDAVKIAAGVAKVGLPIALLYSCTLHITICDRACEYRSCERKLHQVIFLLISFVPNALSHFHKLQKKVH